jgi:hypothetical protein
VTPGGTGTGCPFHLVFPCGDQPGWPTLTGATGFPGCAKKIGLEYRGLSGVPETFIVKLDDPANWLAYGLLGAMLCGAAGTFQGLDGANARQTGAAGAGVAVASATPVSARSVTMHAVVRAERTQVSV